MKLFFILSLFVIVCPAYAGESDYHFKTIFKNQNNLNQFTGDVIKSHEFESKSEVKEYLDASTQGLFFHNFVTNTPLISEMIYQTSKNPDSIAALLGISIKTNELIYFSVGMLFSFILAYFLGDFQFHFKPFGMARTFYLPFRLLIVNGFRFVLFVQLFGENISPILKVYMQSLDVVKLDHQNLYIFSSFMQDFFNVL